MAKCKTVFSKQKFIEDVGQEDYEYFKSQHKEPYWVDVCDGLTEEEMNALNYAAVSLWMIEVKEDEEI